MPSKNPKKKLSKAEVMGIKQTVKNNVSTQKGFDYTYADNIKVARKPKEGKAAVSFRKKEGTVKYIGHAPLANTNYKSTGSKKGKAK